MAEKAQMTLIHSEFVNTDAQGVDWYRVLVTTPAEPNLNNLQAVDIDGFPPNGGIAAGSIFLYPDKQYKIVYTDTNVRPAPGPEEEDSMIIKITETETTYTTDKTAAEIREAMQADKFIVAQYTMETGSGFSIVQLSVAAYMYDSESDKPYGIMVMDEGNALISAEHAAGAVFFEAPTDAEPLVCAKTQG